jgi:glycosyltransferase involved in cell wall biosynthesis
MIITFVHNFKKVTAIYQDFVAVSSFNSSKKIQELLFDFAQRFPDANLLWVHESLANQVNYDWLLATSKNQVMYFFNPSETEFLSEKVGYVEPSPYIKINKEINYPSWQVSVFVGCVSAKDFVFFGGSFLQNKFSFGYFLTIMAKIGHHNGFRTYSNPNLLQTPAKVKPYVGTTQELFNWTAQYYGFSKCFQLFLLLVLVEKQFPILHLLAVVFVKRIATIQSSVSTAVVPNHLELETVTLDVLIPTIGRKPYLYDVLSDLKLQTKIPNRVIIVEQNPLITSQSELDYLKDESWPFEIVHHFIHQTGACNARNIALKAVQSDWVFFADDDIKLAPNFIEACFKTILNSNEKAFTLACFKSNEKPVFHQVMHWDTFGSGCSIVKKEALDGLRFDMRFENGFGEDADFGMQLRNKGIDILYLPSPQILHLKAPVGGFRVEPILPWQEEVIQPKPSPTVMLFKKMYHTKEQLVGYQLNLFLKYYKNQSIKNPFAYYKTMQKQWEMSVKWASILKSQAK